MQKLFEDEIIYIYSIFTIIIIVIYTDVLLYYLLVPIEKYMGILNYYNLKCNLKIQTLKLHE